MGYLTESWGQALINKVKSELTKKKDNATFINGSYAFASLPAPSAATLGYIYNVTDDFTTTTDFIEGAGTKVNAGTDVVVVQVDAVPNPLYKFNLFSTGGGENLTPITDVDLEEMWKDPEDITIDNTTLSLSFGGIGNITVTTTSSGITAESSDTNVATATVDTTGASPIVHVTYAGPGAATVTIRTAGTSELRSGVAKCEVICS